MRWAKPTLNPQIVTFQGQLQDYLQYALQPPSFRPPLATFSLDFHSAIMIIICHDLHTNVNHEIQEIEKYMTNVNTALSNHDDLVEKEMHFLQLLYIMRRFLMMEFAYLKTL